MFYFWPVVKGVQNDKMYSLGWLLLLVLFLLFNVIIIILMHIADVIKQPISYLKHYFVKQLPCFLIISFNYN